MIKNQLSGVNEGRRNFLSDGRNWLSFGVILALLYPLFRFLGFKLPREPRQIRVNSMVKQSGFMVEHDFILFDRKEGLWAVSRTCTHLGCRLTYKENEDILLCPCHQSSFKTNGKNIKGPARRDLPVFQVEVLDKAQGGGYLVTI